MIFGQFYLDREKDMIVTLEKNGEEMTYVLSTPNHHSGNLITNLAKLCDLPLSSDENGLVVIRGTVPCYIDAYNQEIYIFRLGGTKVANIYPDGRIEMKASVPSISKTLMSQTKDYQLDIAKTIIKTYLFRDCKFHADLHTHMNANLYPDTLIALGIAHQIQYPLYYIKKLDLRCSERQQKALEKERLLVAEEYKDSGLVGKYLDRKIDDHTYINFADLILNNLKNAAYNIPRIRASLAVMKDGQAVFTNLERVYLYRYIFTKGKDSAKKIAIENVDRIPDPDIAATLNKMLQDQQSLEYKNNTLYQDKLLWIARTYAQQGIQYVEISDTSLVKKETAAKILSQIHEVMPKIYHETGVMIRFLAGIRRIPLTIVKDNITPNDYLNENLMVLKAIAMDPYVAGSDILGEEINDIREIQPVIKQIVAIAKDDPSYVVRIHAGENDSLRDNVANSIDCVSFSLSEGQKMPRMRIGHGLYTSNLRSYKGRELLQEIKDKNVVLEFQITSNVRLNNLSKVEQHPLKQYLKAGVRCVQGTDGCALYGTDSIDEQLSLEKLLGLSHEDLLKMRKTEKEVVQESLSGFSRKQKAFDKAIQDEDVETFYQNRILESVEYFNDLFVQEKREDSSIVFADKIEEISQELTPVILAGGSFNNDKHRTVMQGYLKDLIDDLLQTADPAKICFVIGHHVSGYEKYLLQQNHGRFKVYAFVPSTINKDKKQKILKADVKVRVAIEPTRMGLYKSITYEIFKERPSILLALDGNSALANLIQEAKNGRVRSQIFVNFHSKMLKEKAQSLQGYITPLTKELTAEDILSSIK